MFFVIRRFLETDKYRWYGMGAIVDLLNGTEWKQSGMFPRVSLCDFEVSLYSLSLRVKQANSSCFFFFANFEKKGRERDKRKEQ